MTATRRATGRAGRRMTESVASYTPTTWTLPPLPLDPATVERAGKF